VVNGDLSDRMDRSSALPLWAQLREDLVGRIAAGEFADGFPGEHALTAAYGVSRRGVREALRHLASHGHREIAFIAGSQDDLAGDTGERLNAYLAAPKVNRQPLSG
jgi:hypothetical protein